MDKKDGYICYIVNPNSGASSNKRLVREFKDYLESKNQRIQTRLTTSLGHANELGNQAAVDYDCKLVVAAGGDGTIREVAQGLEGSDKPMLTVPCGTENLLANELGFDLHLKTLIKAFEGNNIRPLDIAMINGRAFLSIAGFGFDGDVIHQIHNIRKGHINHLDYFWPLWRTFWSYPFPRIKVKLDGKEEYEGPGLVFVGNISRYAIGLGILKKADYGDGLLDVCIFTCNNQLTLLKLSVFTIFKIHTKSKHTIYKQCKEIDIEPIDKPVYSEIDGDPGPTLPAEIRLIAGALKVVVPPHAKPAGIRTRLQRMIG
ncbi:YegS/Rv2252/BmrU family lipid kinase [candidate division KSB1 bacterium]|nr:YegS/Rv2252/BmrU family lipid kinase [candidate division KSB1 bacterium]